MDNTIESKDMAATAEPYAPNYETYMKIFQSADLPPPPLYDEPVLRGITGYPTDPPPSYHESVTHNDESATKCAIGYVDFLPKCMQQTRGSVDIPIYEDFKTLVSKLNHWLQGSLKYHVVRCEMLEVKLLKGEVSVSCTTEHKSIYGANEFIRGLRAWIKLSGAQDSVQKICYVDVEPSAIAVKVNVISGRHGYGSCYATSRQTTTYPDFKNLDDVLEELNEKLKTEPIPGEILCIETTKIKVTQNNWDLRLYTVGKPSVDPDCSYWKVRESDSVMFLDVLRIFYVVGQPQAVEIGMVDFVPNVIDVKKSAITTFIFEPLSDVMKKCNEWILANSKTARVVNVNMVPFTFPNAFFANDMKIKNRRTYHHTPDMGTSTLVNFIRVAYVKPGHVPPLQLSVKMFVPVRNFIKKTSEDLTVLMQRVNSWLKVTGCEVAFIDTITTLFDPNVKKPINGEDLSFRMQGLQSQDWLTTIRLYIWGHYEEPTADVCPPALDYELSSSSCSLL